MIYIIDDKRSRQRDYGWDEDRFKEYEGLVMPIWSIEAFTENQQSMLMEGNVILFHESFLLSNEDDKNQIINSFKVALKDLSSSLYIAYFSGSKNGRYVDDNICMLPPDVLYTNLYIFIKKIQNGEKNFEYLAFGENYKTEELIRRRLEEVNDANVGGEKHLAGKNIFFAVTSNDEVEPPFEDVKIVNGWDFFDENVSDSELDGLVQNWFNETKYESIYLPLYFGNVYSDNLGLRLAMHVRLTDTVNKGVPIFIYGISSYQDVCDNECFEVFKFSSVYLIGADNKSLSDSQKTDLYGCNIQKDIKRILLNVPSNIGDTHSVANRWAISRWCDMLKWKNEMPNLLDKELSKSLYYKFLVAKYGRHDRFPKKHKYDAKINGIAGKTILYIDDEYDKGWETILRYIFESSDAKFVCFKDFDKKMSRDELIDRITNFLETQDADCYLVDLRLHEDDFSAARIGDLTGHAISKYIKSQNAGNQIVVFSASNKVWNLNEEIFKIGASGYALKESPDMNLDRTESLKLFQDFVKAIQLACKMSYLKELVIEQQKLKDILPAAEQLDCIINLLSKDHANNDKSLLGAALLSEIVFIEDYVKNILGYELFGSGKREALKIELCSKEGQKQMVTGHLFFKRVQNGAFTTVTDVSDYYKDISPVQSGWCNVSKSDVTLVASVLMMIFKLSRLEVKKYIDFKYIRNTQIAHSSEEMKNQNLKQIFTSEKIVDFYKTVICPIVKKSQIAK